jgi:hypothetical protein
VITRVGRHKIAVATSGSAVLTDASRPGPGLRRAFGRRLRYLAALLYQPQVKLQFPMDVLIRRVATLPATPPGYVVRSPSSDEDLTAWATLLNEDEGFPRWTAERVREDLVARQVAPDAATLVFHGGQLVGCASACDASTARPKEGVGMYLFLKPAHRGRSGLAELITLRTATFFVRERYERVLATSDPHRLSVLTLHLSLGFVPIRDSLWSYVQWWKIRRRLRRVVERKVRRQGR